jgi:hypothetical protein
MTWRKEEVQHKGSQSTAFPVEITNRAILPELGG